MGTRLKSRLSTQAPAIKEICVRIAAVDLANDEDGSRKIGEGLGQLVRLAHELRDAIQEAAIAIILEEGRLIRWIGVNSPIR